jgi:hypothetical protein
MNHQEFAMYNYAEKRKYIRIEKPYMARFRVKPEGNQGVVSTGWDMVAVNDLGAGGVFFNSSNNLEIGTVVNLKIGFSTTMPSIKCDGIVTRVINHPNTFIFGVVTVFTKIDEHIKEMINKVAELNYRVSTPAVLSLAS